MDPYEVPRFVSDDIVNNLKEWFEPLQDEQGDSFESPSFTALKDAPITSTKNVTAVQWTYRCTHVKEYYGVVATKRPLTIRGVTIVEHEGATEEAMYYRYIDWLDVFAQLGLGIHGRTPIDSFVDVTSDIPIET